MKFIALTLLSLAGLVSALDEQHFTVGITLSVDGVIGDPNNPKCTEAIESTFKAAYDATYPDSDVTLESVTFTKVTPGFMNMLRLGTSGSYTYNGSGDNSCKRCNPALSATFSSKQDLLKAVGTTDAFETTLLSMLQSLPSNDCNSFKKVTDVTVEWIRGIEAMKKLKLAYSEPVQHYVEEQHFTVGITLSVDGVIGDPNNPKCTAAIESTFKAAYDATYPDSDVTLESVTFTEVTPGFMNMLRLGTSGSYTYKGSGDNSCKRCNPVVSATFLGKDVLLEAIGTNDAFEANLLSMLQALTSSDCNSFKKITDVTVEWIRSAEMAA
jgi:hypothetical protein